MLIALKTNWKRYLISSLQTFFAVFLPLTIPQLLEMDWNNLDSAAIAGILVVSVRLGLKAVWEYWYYTK